MSNWMQKLTSLDASLSKSIPSAIEGAYSVSPSDVLSTLQAIRTDLTFNEHSNDPIVKIEEALEEFLRSREDVLQSQKFSCLRERHIEKFDCTEKSVSAENMESAFGFLNTEFDLPRMWRRIKLQEMLGKKETDKIVSDEIQVGISQDTNWFKRPKPKISENSNECAGCGLIFEKEDSMFTSLIQRVGWGQVPRFCEFTGNFFCSNCHVEETRYSPWALSEGRVGLISVCRTAAKSLTVLSGKREIIISDFPQLLNAYPNLKRTHELREIVRQQEFFLIAKCAGFTISIDDDIYYSFQEIAEAAEGKGLFIKLTNIFIEICHWAHMQASLQDRLSTNSYSFPVCPLCAKASPPLLTFTEIGTKCDHCKTFYHKSCMSRSSPGCPLCASLGAIH